MSLTAKFSLRRGSLTVDVDLAVPGGATLALVGPNGAGKTTCLRAIAGLQAIDRGHITIDSKVVDGGPNEPHVPAEARQTGVVFQDHLLFPHMRVVDNVAFGLVNRGVHRRLARAAAQTWLERTGMSEYSQARPAELSGGQAQRVAIARALASKPQVLLLDEPLAAVDASARLGLRRVLSTQLQSFDGCCVVVAHDIDTALALADRIAVIEQGRIVQAGSIDEIVHRPASRYVADLIGWNCFRGQCDGNVLRLANGTKLIVGQPVDGAAIATVHPRAVALFRDRPAGSPRNVWRAPVIAVERTPHSVRVRTGGELPIVAEVTESAVQDLQLADGGAIWVAIKATEIHIALA